MTPQSQVIGGPAKVAKLKMQGFWSPPGGVDRASDRTKLWSDASDEGDATGRQRGSFYNTRIPDETEDSRQVRQTRIARGRSLVNTTDDVPLLSSLQSTDVSRLGRRDGARSLANVSMSVDSDSDDPYILKQNKLGVFDDEHGRAFVNKPQVSHFLQNSVVDWLKEHELDSKPEGESPVWENKDDKTRKTLVLEYDSLVWETLADTHTSGTWPKQTAYTMGPGLLLKLDPISYVIKRPGLDEFLGELALVYDIVIYTASTPEDADPILDALENTPGRQPIRFSKRLYENDCVELRPEGHPWASPFKDLTILEKPLRDVVMVDDQPRFVLQPLNLIPISMWWTIEQMDRNELPESDQELLDLLPILKKLAVVDDIQDMWPQVLGRDPVS